MACQLIAHLMCVHGMVCMFFIHCGADSVAGSVGDSGAEIRFDTTGDDKQQTTSKQPPSSTSFPSQTHSPHCDIPDRSPTPPPGYSLQTTQP
ncbi:hypothetical protein BKA57DRAFT_460600 [Linnemannia elongata]|nr:hypothetical protein BKA57DRAFT_460600 [Linnemannia elongata]